MNTTHNDFDSISEFVANSVVFSVEKWHVADNQGGVVTTHYAQVGDCLGYGSTRDEAEDNLIKKVCSLYQTQ